MNEVTFRLAAAADIDELVALRRDFTFDTRPGFRGHGIGARLLRHVQQAAREADVELVIVWPSDTSRAFYEREGFAVPDDPLIWDSGI